MTKHETSQCHKDAVLAESKAAAAQISGGIQTALDQQVSMKLKAVIGALKCLYWLAKEETDHHTKFGSLLHLAKSLGCSYLSPSHQVSFSTAPC